MESHNWVSVKNLTSCVFPNGYVSTCAHIIPCTTERSYRTNEECIKFFPELQIQFYEKEMQSIFITPYVWMSRTNETNKCQLHVNE